MKKIVFLLILIVPTSIFGQVIKETDEFTGHISYRTGLFSIQSHDVLEAKGSFIYQSETGLSFILLTYDREYQHQHDRIAYFLMDEERIEIQIQERGGEYDANGRNFVFQDQLLMDIDEPFLRSISNAESTRFKIGENVYEFSPTAEINAQSMLTEISEITE